MPKDSDLVEQTISTEIELMKQEGKIARNAQLVKELSKISEVVRNKQIRSDS